MTAGCFRRGLVCVLTAVWLVAGVRIAAQEAPKRAITFDDMISMHRLSEAQLSPDGKWVLYTVTTPDMDANRNAMDLWMAPVAGGEAIELTREGIRRPGGRRTARRSRSCRRAAANPRCTCFRWKAARRTR